MNETPMKIEIGRDYRGRDGDVLCRVVGHVGGLVLMVHDMGMFPVTALPEEEFLESYVPFVPHTEALWRDGFVRCMRVANPRVTLACYLQDSDYGWDARPMFRVPDQRDAAIASLRGGDKITIQADGSVVVGESVYKQTTIVVDGETIPVVGIGVAEIPFRPAFGVSVDHKEGDPFPWEWSRCEKPKSCS